MNRKTFSKGFTLIELLVVISIIGAISAVLLVNFVGVRERAADTKTKNDLTQFKTAMRLYYNDYKTYPLDSGQNTVMGCGSSGTTACTPGAPFAVGTNTYMKEMPNLSVYQNVSGDRFYACSELQNEGDPDLAASRSKCNLTVTASAPKIPFISQVFAASADIDTEDFCVCSD